MVKKLVLVKNGVAHPINVGGVVTPGSYVLAFSGKNSLIFHSEDGNEITVSQGHSDSPDESIFNIFNFERDKGISFGIFELDENDNMNPKSVLYVDKDNGVSLNGKKLENVSEEHVDTKDVETLESAKEYADTQDETILNTAKGYADTQDETTLDTAKGYADTQDETILDTAKEYADTQDETTLDTAKEYADTQDETTLDTAKEYADTQDETTLDTAKEYADTQDETILDTAKEYADTQDETILDTAKEYADGKVSKSGDTMSGTLDMDNHGISSAGVLADVSAIVAKDGNLLIKGQINLDADHGQPKDNIKNVKTPVDATDAANKSYVDTAGATKLDKITTGTGAHAYMHNGETQGETAISSTATGSTIAMRNADGTTSVATPTETAHAANKGYVDAHAVPPITTLTLSTLATETYHLIGTINRASSTRYSVTTVMCQFNLGAGGGLDRSFILTLPTTYVSLNIGDLRNNSRKINIGSNAAIVGIFVYLNTATDKFEIYLRSADVNYTNAVIRIQPIFHTALPSLWVTNSSGAAVSLPSGAVQVPESNGLTGKNLALGNDTRFAASNSYKLANTGEATIIDLGEKIPNGAQVFIDLVYDETTSSGIEVVHAYASFSLYGNTATDSRNSVSLLGFGSSRIIFYHCILSNGHDAIFVVKLGIAYYPSVVIISAYKNSNDYATQPTGTPLAITVTTEAEPDDAFEITSRVLFPTPPTSGTYYLKSVNGVVNWVLS